MKPCALSLCLVRNHTLFVNLRVELTWGTGDKELTWCMQVGLVAKFALLERLDNHKGNSVNLKW